MKTCPLRLRIALLSTLLSGAVMVIFGTAAWWVVAQQKTATLDARIRALGTRVPGWMLQDREFGRLEQNIDFVLETPDGGSGHFMLVASTSGKVLHQSTTWPEDLNATDFTSPLQDDPLAASGHESHSGRGWGGSGRGRGPGGSGGGPGGGQPLRFTKIPEFSPAIAGGRHWRVGRLGNAELTLVVGLSADATAAELLQLRRAGFIALPVALLLIGLGGWVVAGRALRPLQRIAATAASVTSQGLDQRIPAIGGDPEIVRMVEMLNGMMDRLEAGFRQAIRFSADASHELKTPLAIMRGEIEQAIASSTPGSPEQRTLNSLLEETHRLGAIIRSLLLLSRADAGRLVTTREPVDLTQLLEELVEDTAASAEASGIRVASAIAPGIRVSGDEALLRTAILNLLGNAVKHNLPNGRVTIDLTRSNQDAVLEIANTGPTIPQDERDEIFDRFRRGRAARDHARDGVGLGLSLAREIIAGHDGTLGLAPDRGDGMVRFVMTLPAG
jgi:signal transduction histidine kinase